MTGLTGIIDLSNIVGCSDYHEFESMGSGDLQVVLPTVTNIGYWFSGKTVSAIAGSKDELEDKAVKIPNGYKTIHGSAFSNTTNISKLEIADSVEEIGCAFGGDGSWTYVKTVNIGSGCKMIYGGFLSSNHTTYTVICNATTPPTMGVRSVWGSGNYDYDDYPFAEISPSVIYVPDDSVTAYKEDTSYAIWENNAWTTGNGQVTCHNQSREDQRTVGWSRFASIIKPLSEYKA